MSASHIAEPARLAIRGEGGVALAGEEAGQGAAIVLLHGLTATRRYVVMGSRSLQRSGHRVIAYDARGHGSSAPAHERAYGYEHLAADLLAVLDAAGVQRALLAGASMGAHTALALALAHPERVSALALITPAYDPDAFAAPAELARWDALAEGLRDGGVEGFVAAYGLASLPERWRATAETALRQRLAAHEHPAAVADALEVVPRSRPFAALAQLRAIAVPVLVVASRDEADPGHPLAVGERYARAIPGAQLLVEPEGPPARSPIAWQGGQLSRAIAELAALSAHRG
ncbi:MAG TPA: alpha/beta fold hydrolase [Solirubrobacteraceae bacterium]|nr:alpha/beta fold hydrolase [Solirubrobacteraceae bacterium]